VIGDDILYLHPSADYNVHFPIQRGEINVTPLVGVAQDCRMLFVTGFVLGSI
jgi:hypothetical protein